jgi:SAM-dependent methyltransferase
VAGQSYYFRDFSVTFYPLRLFQARELAAFRLPFWNPYINEGAFVLPALYPLELLHALWPGPAAVSWLLTLHLPLAALAAYLLARGLGLSRRGAACSGALYGAGGLAASSLNLYVFLQALAWAPLLVLAARRAALGPRARTTAGLAAVTAVSLSTMAVEFVAQAVVLALALALAAAPSRRTLVQVGAGLALGAGLAAVPLAVTAGFLGETVRGAGFAREVALGNDLSPYALLQVLVPDLFGPLARPGIGWWGWAFFSKGFPYFASLYLGALPLALAVAGWRGFPPRVRVTLAVLGLLGLWYALGARAGLALALSPLPPWRWFRFPSKALLLPYLALVLLAGAGCDRLRAGQGWGRVAAVLGALAALSALPALLVASGSSWLRNTALVPAWADPTLLASSLGASALAACAALLALAAWRRRLAPAVAAAALAVLAVLELGRAHAGLNPMTSARFYEPLPEMAGQGLGRSGRVFSYGPDESPAFQSFLRGAGEGIGLWSFFVNRQLLAPYNNVLDGVPTAEDKDLTSFVPSPNTLGPGDRDPGRPGPILDVLRNAAVTQVVSLDRLRHPDLREELVTPSGAPGLDLHVYALARPWPAAYVACRARLAASREAALLAPLAPGFDAAHDAAFEAAPPSAADCRAGRVARLDGGASAARYRVEADGAGFLVVRESFARGWTALVDGRAAPVLRANGKHRAVPVPAGSHEVRLAYRPPGLALGLGLMGVSLLVLAGLVLAPARAAAAPAPPGPARELALLCPACGGPLPPGAGERSCPACGASYPERDGVLFVTTSHEARPAYDPHYFDTLPHVEGRHFWFLARREVIVDGIKDSLPDWPARPLFDIGCGTGGLLAYLAGAGIPVAGACDAYLRAVETTRARLPVPVLLVDEDGPPPLAAGQPALAMFDVLEHIDDDEAALRWMHAVLEPGGALVLTVPAHPRLFGPADRLAHHRRRYTRRELDRKLRAAGFEVRRLTHFMAPLVPLLALSRGLAHALGRHQDKDAELRVVPGLNAFLRLVLRLERAWLRRFPLPFGSSLLAVAVRPAPAPR